MCFLGRKHRMIGREADGLKPEAVVGIQEKKEGGGSSTPPAALFISKKWWDTLDWVELVPSKGLEEECKTCLLRHSPPHTYIRRLTCMCVCVSVFHSLHLKFLSVGWYLPYSLSSSWFDRTTVCVFIKFVLCICICVCVCVGVGWYLKWILNLWLPPNPAQPRPTPPSHTVQARTEQTRQLRLTCPRCAAQPLCAVVTAREGAKEWKGVAFKVLPDTYRRAEVLECSPLFIEREEKKNLLFCLADCFNWVSPDSLTTGSILYEAIQMHTQMISS